MKPQPPVTSRVVMSPSAAEPSSVTHRENTEHKERRQWNADDADAADFRRSERGKGRNRFLSFPFDLRSSAASASPAFHLARHVQVDAPHDQAHEPAGA